MKVAFNARLLHSPDLRGWNRYTVNLLAELPPLGVEPFLYSDRPIHPGHLARLPGGSYRVCVGAVRPYVVWEQVWLPLQCGRDRVDLLHAPANFGLPWSSPCPRVLTLHDAIGTTSLRGRLLHRAARTRAHRVITVSEHARGELVETLGIPSGRVRVTPEAADPLMAGPLGGGDRARTRARYGLDRPYVFYVGGWEARKNVAFLVRAFGASGLDGVDLVLAGGHDDQRGGLEALGSVDRLRLLGWVDDADLPALYAEALGFVYPSRHEGFGLQLCEAMAAGCPVLAARASSLPEVLGGGGETFGLDTTDELVGLLRRLASEPGFRDELSRRARARSADFSWRRTAEATAAVYRELVRGADRGRPCASAARS